MLTKCMCVTSNGIGSISQRRSTAIFEALQMQKPYQLTERHRGCAKGP